MALFGFEMSLPGVENVTINAIMFQETDFMFVGKAYYTGQWRVRAHRASSRLGSASNHLIGSSCHFCHICHF